MALVLVKWAEENNWTFGFEFLGRNITPLNFKTERVAKTAWTASWFWRASGRFLGTWGRFSNPRNSRLTRDGLGFQWNGQRKDNWTLGFELLGRNRAPLYLKTKRVAESALRTAWFLPTSVRLSGTWGRFSIPRDSKLSRDGLGFHRNGQRKNN